MAKKLINYINSLTPTKNKAKPQSLPSPSSNRSKDMKIVELISDEYLSNRDDWVKIVFAMKRSGFDEQEALRISNKATDCQLLTDDEWSSTWNSEDGRAAGLSMGTLHYYAKLSNESEYAKLTQKSVVDE